MAWIATENEPLNNVITAAVTNNGFIMTETQIESYKKEGKQLSSNFFFNIKQPITQQLSLLQTKLSQAHRHIGSPQIMDPRWLQLTPSNPHQFY